MQPESGTYGRVADTERLKAQLNLPGTGPGGAEVAPTPPTPGLVQGSRIQQPVGGVPDVLMRPTDRPDVPASTPLGANIAPPSVPQATHIRALEALVASPTTSQATKMWAQAVMERMRS
jgi:hypothetical protein